MKPLCVLFAHHKNDELTNHHLQLLKKHNTGIDIIPVFGGNGEGVEGAVELPLSECPLKFRNLVSSNPHWYFCDRMLYMGFIKFPHYERYLWLEYDTYCSQPIKEAYASVWDAPAVCRDYVSPDNHPKWGWWRDKVFLKDKENIRGVAPLNCFLASHQSMQAIVEHAPRESIFSELRIGTALLRANITPSLFPEALRKTIVAHRMTPKRTPGLYHAVKKIYNDDVLP